MVYIEFKTFRKYQFLFCRRTFFLRGDNSIPHLIPVLWILPENANSAGICKIALEGSACRGRVA